MYPLLRALALLLLLPIAAPCQAEPEKAAASAPFAAALYQGETASLKADTDFAASFRSNLAAGLKQGVNFAGDQVLVTWGCGSGCIDGGVVSARSGRAVPLPFTLHRPIAQDRPDLLYQSGSRLLVAHGLFVEEQEEASGRCFVWEKEGEWRELEQSDCTAWLPESFDPARLTAELAGCRKQADGDRQSFERCLLEISRQDILAFQREVEQLGGRWEMRMATEPASLVSHFLHTSALIYRLPSPASQPRLRRQLNGRLHEVLGLVFKREELRRAN